MEGRRLFVLAFACLLAALSAVNGASAGDDVHTRPFLASFTEDRVYQSTGESLNLNSLIHAQGYDRPYDDLPGMPITLPAGSDPSVCAKLCDQNPKCVAWAFSKPECDSPYSCWLKNPLPPLTKNSCRVTGLREKLKPLMYAPLTVGEIKPEQWLKNQLELQADGLCGYLALFWPDIANSTWIGGKTNDPGGLNERVPYWLNGMVPLASLLPHHASINAQVQKYISYIVGHQTADGWFGTDCCDPWPRYPLLLALTQYSEGNPQDQRIVPAILKGLKRLRDEIEKNPLSSWAQYRWQDLSLTVYWMYDKHPELQQHDFLLDMGEILHTQGFAWDQFFASQQFPKIACRGTCPSLATHGVNCGQAVKSSAVWYRQSHSVMDYYSSLQRTDVLDRYHGQASGIFSCSEHLAGLVPSQGSETCTVVETMFSFETLFSVFGNVTHADRVEQLAFNALAAALTPEMWAHVYLQQGNQINSQHDDPNIYVTDGPDSNIYGLAPNFGCCTVNFPQGWPKFATQLFMRTADDSGLVAAFYAPATVNTTISGKSVGIVLNTKYPFSEKLLLTVDSETNFPLFLRIPCWANGATVQVGQSSPRNATSGTLYQVNIPRGQTSIRIVVPMEFRIERRYNNAVTILRGPLVYVLKMDEKWHELKHYAFNSSDWQIEPTSPWNYALKIDVSNPSSSLRFIGSENVGNLPFSSNGTPVKAIAKGRILPAWGIVDNAAAPPPQSPVKSTSPLVDVTLVPFGAARLRIAEFPLLDEN